MKHLADFNTFINNNNYTFKILPKLNNTVDTLDNPNFNNNNFTNNVINNLIPTHTTTNTTNNYNYINTAYNNNFLITEDAHHKKENNINNNLQEVMKYFNTETSKSQEKTKNFLTTSGNTFYKKTNTNFYQFTNLKKKLVNPNEIVEEMKQKFDLHKKIREISKNTNEIFNSTKFDQDFQKLKLKKINGIKLINKSSNTIENNLIKIPITEISKSSIKSNLKINQNLHKFLKANELTQILSKDKNKSSIQKELIENIFLQNLIETFQNNFPEKFNQIKHYFKYNTTLINSENKQIQMFVVVLEIILKNLDEINTNNNERKNIENLNDNFQDILIKKSLEIIDSIFSDFIRHLNSNSNHRSEFLKKIWLKRNFYIENQINNLIENNENLKEKIDKILDENKTIKNQLDKLTQDKDDTRIDIKVLNKQNEKWLEYVIEKDMIENEMKNKIEILEKDLEDINFKYNELMEKFNARLNPNFRKLVYEEFNGNRNNLENEFELDENNSLQNENVINNNIKSFHKKLTVITKNINIEEENIKTNSSNNQEINYSLLKINLDMKNLVQSRKSRIPNITKTLKLKVDQVSNIDKKKNNNILQMDKEIKNEIIKEIVKSKGGFDLYTNKGINFTKSNLKENSTQTEIQSIHLQNLITNFSTNELNIQSDHIIFNIESLNNVIKRISEKENNNHLNKLQIEESEKILQIIKINYLIFTDEFAKVIEERDLLCKINLILNEELEKNLENSENIFITYSEVFKLFLDFIKETNDDLSSFLGNQNNLSIGTMELINSILKRNYEITEKEKLLPIYKFLPKPEIIKNFDQVLKKENILNQNFDRKIINNSNKFLEIYETFYNTPQNKKINVNLSEKKIFVIIYQIYFEMIEKIYFKNVKTNFDIEEYFVDFPEVVHIYFMQNFGLESLVNKKFLEFIQAVMHFGTHSKRILIFSKLMKLHKNRLQNNEKNKLGNFDNFVMRQLILFIQMIKNYNILIKLYDDNYSVLYLLNTKLNEIVNNLLNKFVINSNIKNIIQNFFDKNKKVVTKNLKNLNVFDFDDVIEFMANVLFELKNIQSNILIQIFNAIDVEKKDGLSLFDFYIINQYLFKQKLNYEQIKLYFERFAEKNLILKFEQFETICIEGDLLDDNLFYEYLKISDENVLKNIFISLQEELRASAMTIFDDMNKRLHVIRYNTKFTNLSSKILIIKQNITHDEILESEVIMNWITIKVLDDISLDIYNEFQVFKIFKNLEDIYKILEESETDKKQDNMVIKFLRDL